MKSKKPSDASFASKLPEPYVFLLDQCLGSTLVAEVIRDDGGQVEFLADHFNDDTPDDIWLAEAGQRGWVVLTKDRRIRRRLNELAALMRGGTRAFAVAGANMRGAEIAHAIRLALPAIKQYVRDFPAPFVAAISSHGRVSMILRSKDIEFTIKEKS